MPTIVRNDIDSTSAQITVTIARDELKSKVDSELKRIRHRAAIKGFRQGQAPMPYVRKMFGPSILVDTFNDMMSHEVYTYLKESRLEVLGQPLPAENQQHYSFNLDALDPEYTVVYDIGFVNAFELKGLDKNQIFEKLTPADIDRLVDDDLEYARTRMGKRSHPDDDIQDNDIIRIAAREVDGDYETTIILLGKSIADEDLKNELLGKKKGDTIRFNARLIENQKSEASYRKYVLNIAEDDDRTVNDWFEGPIEEVTRQEKADLNEEFFHGYFGDQVNSPEEARDELKKGILGFYDVRANAMLMRNFQERLIELNRLPLPDAFLKRWLLVSNEGKLSAEQVENEYEPFAENLRWTLIRDKIKDEFGIEVTDAEIRAAFARKVRQYFQADLPDNVIDGSVNKLMNEQKDVDETRRHLESDKIFEAVRSQVTIVDKPIDSKDFHRILDELTKKSESDQTADPEVEAHYVE